MLVCSAKTNEAIPVEFRKTAEALFPPCGYKDGISPAEREVQSFADMLGIGLEFSQIMNDEPSEREAFLNSFKNNIDILIQKTWVDKDDEFRKQRLQERVPGLINLVENDDYRAALTEFGDILDELSFLLFGAQSRQEDFTEYTMRIDEQMGLFWWYGSHLADLAKIEDERAFFPVLLIGLCYLTNF
ncbi:MAG: hypothetical protein LBM77_07790 [Spirochaetaceae bacterium]|jgi:hypothetical protein|nr:hypothetical protein [Spirochaetaceae bacterium]